MGKKLLFCAIVIVILALIFNPWNPFPDAPPPPKHSYDWRIKFNLDNVQSPTTHDEIVQIVSNAHTLGKKIRVLASGHSWSEIAQTQDIMLSLHDYSGIEAYDIADPAAPKVTVRAGTRLRDLSEELDANDLAMINLGSVAEQSLGGAISTATHGTGLTVGNLAALVTKVEFVSGTGETVTLSEDDEDNSRFRAAVVSIGTFGVLSKITIRVERKFKLKELRTSHTLDHCLDNLEEYVEGHEYVKMWVEFQNNFCCLYQTQKATDDEPIKNRPWKIEVFFTYYLFAVTTRITYLLSFLTKPMMWLVNTIGLGMTRERVDYSYLIFNDYFELPIHQESEIIVPYSESVALVRAIRDVVLTNNVPVNYITEVRFIKGDNNHLSPQYGMTGGSCAVTLTIFAKKDVVKEYFDAVYEATRTMNGRIHWGKHFSHADRSSFLQWYPKFSEFATLRKEYDPDGIFVNDFIKEKFKFQ